VPTIMKTEIFIKLLAHDSPPSWRLHHVLALATAAGTTIAAAIFFSVIGCRPDISEAARSARFLFKFVVTIGLAASAMAVVFGAGRPGRDYRWRWSSLAIAPTLLLSAALVELFVVPERQWLPRLIGHNARICLTLIPLLSIAPLGCFLMALRYGAPSNPSLAGAAARLAASGIAATFYAANCTDDSPLFVATWYPLAILVVTFTASLIGSRVLRW
jgi:hypothetical protein